MAFHQLIPLRRHQPQLHLFLCLELYRLNCLVRMYLFPLLQISKLHPHQIHRKPLFRCRESFHNRHRLM